MKKILFATAFAAAALASAPAFAQSVGYLGLSYAHSEVEILSVEADGEAVAFEGSVTAPVTETISLSFNGSVAEVEDETIGSGTIHLSDRLESGLIGGFAGVTQVADESLWAIGMEGEAYLSNVTLAATVAFASSDNLDADFRLYNAEARLFANDNLRFDGGLGYADGEVAGVDLSGWSAGFGGEYQFTGHPVSIVGGYTRSTVEDLDLTADTVSVGIRWTFGGSLRDRDAAAGGLNGIGDLVGGLIF